MHPLLTLVIAVYNRPEALRLILAACRRQTFLPFEIVIADDGSGDAITAVIEEASRLSRQPILRAWQPDDGWRKNKALNAAVRMASADYLVFIDGDCIPHSRFLEDHWHAREDRAVLCGRRVELSPAWTARMTLDTVRSGRYETMGMREWWDGVRGRALRVEDGIRIASPRVASLLHGNVRGLLGSNFSLHREQLARINGFDEAYEGPGSGEDSDIQFRLELLGVAIRSLRHRAIQYHLWHARTRASKQSEQRFEEVKRQRAAWCDRGLAEPASEAAC
jgi:glycosyltransferase involved in cell wall biosynthesis